MQLVNRPASVDWVAAGAVTPIKNQGNCGSCYTFSSTGALEGAHFLSTQSLLSFSEQLFLDCSMSYGTGNHGCNGWSYVNVFIFTYYNGVMLESEYGYEGIQNACSYNKQDALNINWYNHHYWMVPVNNPSAMLDAISQQPVSVGIDASTQDFMLY